MSSSGTPNVMTHGMAAGKKREELAKGHPIQESEENFEKRRLAAEMEGLRRVQGMHAPLRIMMERAAASKVGHLPCITSRSNVHADVLSGMDEVIRPSDVFGKPEHFEGLSTPHAIIEKHLSEMKL